MNTSGTAIEVERLRKLYGQKVAVDDVSFTVAEGEIFGLLGRNGAGKSTTVDCVVGRRPTLEDTFVALTDRALTDGAPTDRAALTGRAGCCGGWRPRRPARRG